MRFINTACVGLASLTIVLAARLPSPKRADSSPELLAIAQGNADFRKDIANNHGSLFQNLTKNGQHPDFFLLGCSDSRVSESTVFNALPGTVFAARNIANQVVDIGTSSAFAYAITVLGVKHVVVMGHYGCGGVAASIASPPEELGAAAVAVQEWIEPIRGVYAQSTRSEIVELRKQNKGLVPVPAPALENPGFRALVEENVRAGVHGILDTAIIKDQFKALELQSSKQRRADPVGALHNVFIHGWVYDIADGSVKDLGMSFGPPGVAVPAAPWAVVQAAANHVARSH